MRLQVGIVFKGDVDAPADIVDLLRDVVADVVVAARTRPVCRDLRHGRLVEIDRLVEKARAVLQDDDALFEIVVDLRSVVLDLLLELGEIVPRLDLHKQKDDAGDDAEDPEEHLEDDRPHARLDGELFFDDGDVTPRGIDGILRFVQFVCHLLFLLN